MEKEIRKLLHEAAPHPNNPTSFQMRLIARLDEAEQIKCYYDREVRHTRRTIHIVFLAGLVLGIIISLLLSIYPINLQDSANQVSIMSFYERLLSAVIPDQPSHWHPITLLICFLAFLLPLILTRRHLRHLF